MSGGGGTTSSTTSNAPPQQFLDAYSQVMNRANGVASTPYQQYPGQLQAPFSPMQNQGFDVIGSAPGVQAPYLNAAATDYANATNSLQPLMQPYVNQAGGYYQQAANTNLPGAVSPWQSAAAQGFGAGSQTLTPQQYSGAAVNQYMSPYINDVVQATEGQFANTNAQQQAQLQGNAASQGALGGDRVGVAQAVLAGQQQAQEAPIIAGLYNNGFNQAQGEFNNQQQTNLSAQLSSQQLMQQAAQGYLGLGSQSLTAAQQQAALAMGAGQGFAGLGQAELGAGQAQGWLNAQAGAGMAGLGNEALAGTLGSGNALLSAGALQQNQAQQGLNIPYEQWQAAQAFPYQQTGWVANIAEGLGSNSGTNGIGSSTVPGASVGSQIAGAGLAGAGLYTALNGAGTAAANGAAQGSEAASQFISAMGSNRGGAIPHRGFAGGGRINPARGFAGGGLIPGIEDIVIGDFGVPQITSAIGGDGPAGKGAKSFLTRDYGSTTVSNTDSPHDSIFGDIVKAIGTAAATWFGGPAGFSAAMAADNALHFNKGGHVPHRAAGGYVPVVPRGFAAGGTPEINVTTESNAQGRAIPTMHVNSAPAASSQGQSQTLSDYLAGVSAGGFHGLPQTYTPPQSGGAGAGGYNGPPAYGSVPGGPQAPVPFGFDQQTGQQNYDNTPIYPGSNRGGMVPHRAGGGMIRGFADGGDLGSDTGSFDSGAPPDDAGTAPGGGNPLLDPSLDPHGLAMTMATLRANPRSNPAGTTQSANPSSGFHPPRSYGDIDSEIADLRQMASNAKPNPGLALAAAGFGMMAGRSPQMGVNIGQGALEGLKEYTSEKKAAQELAARVGDAAARLKESQAWHNMTNDRQWGAVDQRKQAADAAHQDRQDGIQERYQMGSLRLGQQQQQFNERQAQRQEAQDALKTYRDHLATHQSDTLDEQKQWHQWLRTKGLTDQDINLYRSDAMAGRNTTPQQAHDAATGLRNENTVQPTDGTPPIAPTAPAVGNDPLGIR